jgi:exonuclease 1
MGISGLLPLLKSIQKPCTLKKFAGQTLGIDAYGWLHRGTVACAVDLVLDKPTTKHIDFAVSRVRMLLDFNITPYLVFDGDSLPSKAETNAERRKKREESKALGLELLRAGKTTQAHAELQKAAPVTPFMARLFIEELKRMDVPYIVAPYEADAQLVYLERHGMINGILSEDSDMLVYGAKRLITKLSQYADCVEIERKDFALCKEISLAGWTDTMFRRMAILSGCDYLPNIGKMGLKTAYRYIRKHNDPEKVIRMVQFEGKLSVPADYLERFKDAEMTFIHHRVFCPNRREMVHLEELPPGTNAADMPYLGAHMDAETAIGIACGDLDPKSKQPFVVPSARRPDLKSHRRTTVASAADLKPGKSIEEFFKKRQPLAELDPNSMTPSPSQQRLLERHRNTSWETRLTSSAPQLQPSHSRSTIQRTSSASRDTFLSRASAVSTYQAPKRPRLCSETQEASPSKSVKASPFFAKPAVQPSPSLSKARRIRAREAAFDVWSDDSVDDVLLNLPDVQQTASPDKDLSADSMRTSKPDQGVNETEIIPQSSPLARSINSPNESNHPAKTTAPEHPRSAEEAFEDLVESHVQIQRELKTFVYQSDERRASALKTLSPRLPKSKTFIGQSPERQLAALATLPAVGRVDDVCTSIAQSRPVSSSISPARPSSAGPVLEDVGAVPATPLRCGQRVMGSEDAMIPNSEDEGSEYEECVSSLDLRAYAYVQA